MTPLTRQQLNILHRLGGNGYSFGHPSRTLNSLERRGLIVKDEEGPYYLVTEAGVRVIYEDEMRKDRQ